MSEPFVGSIMLFGGNFAVYGWNFCDGSLQSIANYEALYALIGTTYGGDGVSTFGLPDLRGRVPINQGQGSGLTNRNMGEMGGSETVTLSVSQIPQHTHLLSAYSVGSDSHTPANMRPSKSLANGTASYSDQTPDVQMSANAMGSSGSNQPHNNIQPYLAISYQIAFEGIFPTRN